MKKTKLWHRIIAFTLSAGLAFAPIAAASANTLTAYAETTQESSSAAETGESSAEGTSETASENEAKASAVTSENSSEDRSKEDSTEGAASESSSEGSTKEDSAEGAASVNPSEGSTKENSAEGTASENSSEGSAKEGSTEGAASANSSEGSTQTDSAKEDVQSNSADKASSADSAEGATNGKSAAAASGNSSEDRQVKGRAILVYMTGSDLGETPKKDAEAMRDTLSQTNEFQSEDITLIGVTYNSQEDQKSKIWDAVSAAAEQTDEDSYTFFCYIGHGNQTRDGSSYLALEGGNNISAGELKSNLKKLNGKVFVVLASCFSGGMLSGNAVNAAALYEDLDEEDEDAEQESSPQEVQEQVQAVSDAFGYSFLTEFYDDLDEAAEASDTADAANAAGGHKFYFIASATRMETGIQQKEYGTELISAMEHALGHDRYVDSYHTYGADISSLDSGEKRDGYQGDGKITMKELASYFSSNAITSTPILFPDTDESVLFTYTEDKGVPAAFTCSMKQENVAADKDGNIMLRVTFKNLTDRELHLNFGVYTLRGRSLAYTAYTPETVPSELKPQEDRYLQLQGDDTLGPGEVDDQDGRVRGYEAKWNIFYDKAADYSCNPFLLKVWDSSSESETYGSYGTISFFTNQKGVKKYNIDSTKLSIHQPAQLTRTESDKDYTVTNVSELLPVEIQYTYEPWYSSHVNCTLSLYAYDLGENLPEGIRLDEKNDSVLRDKDGKEIPLNSQIEVFKDVQPNPNREGVTTYEPRGGTYTYAMDTAGLTMQHYYVLQCVCHYTEWVQGKGNVEKDKRIYALIRKTTEEEASTYQIPSYTISANDMYAFAVNLGGIPMWSKGWKSTKVRQCTTEEVSAQWKRASDSLFNNKLYSHSISGWKKWVPDLVQGSWVDLGPDDHFEDDTEYSCEIQIKINDDYDAVFTSGTKFSISGHNTVKVDLTSDGKTATIKVYHRTGLPSLEDVTPTLYRVVETYDGEKQVTDEVDSINDTLYAGDEVIVLTKGNLQGCRIVSGLVETKDTVTYKETNYPVYRVKKTTSGEGTSDQVEIAVMPKATAIEEGSNLYTCGCESFLYTWKACMDIEAIHKLELGEEILQQFTENSRGIQAIGGSKREGYGQVKDNQLQNFLNDKLKGAMTVTVKWAELEEGTHIKRELRDNDYFYAGHQYVSTVTFTLLKEYKHIFLQDTVFKVANHTLSTYSSSPWIGQLVRPEISVSEDGQTATIVVVHKLPAVKKQVSEIVTLQHADTGKNIPYEEKLEVKDRITVSAEDGYNVCIVDGLVDTGEKTEDGKEIYRVVRQSTAGTMLSQIELAVIPDAGTDSCGCENLLYLHAIAEVNPDQISSYTVTANDMSTLADSFGTIPVWNGGWESTKSKTCTAEEVSEEWAKALDSLFNTKLDDKLYTHSISEWQKWVPDDSEEKGTWVAVNPDDHFEADTEYRCRLQIKINADSKSLFTKETEFSIYHHDIDDADVELSADGKTAVLTVTHRTGNLKETEKPTLYRVDDKTKAVTELGEDDVLYAEDKVIIRVNGNTKSCQIVSGLTGTKETITYEGIKYSVYAVKKDTAGEGASGQIEISVVPKETGDAGTSEAPCGCGSYLYTWKARTDVAAIHRMDFSAEKMQQFAEKNSGISAREEDGSYSEEYGKVKDNQLETFLSSLLKEAMTVKVKWTEYDEQTKSERPLTDDDCFIAGHQYISTVTFTLLEKYQHIFLQNAEFTAANHTLIGEPEISEDGTTAKIKILHTLPAVKSLHKIVTLQHADTGKSIPYKEELEVKDRITVSAEEGYSVSIISGLADTGEVTAEGKKIYRVVREGSDGKTLSQIALTVIPKADSDGCGCENLLYQHAIAAVNPDQISSYALTANDMSTLADSFGTIPVWNGGWESTKTKTCTAKEVSEEWAKALDSLFNTKLDDKLYTHSISEWQKWVPDDSEEKGTWIAVNPDDHFEADTDYRCRLQIKINTGFKSLFTKETEFTIYQHDIKEEDVELSTDGKTAVLTVTHRTGNLKETEKPTLYRVDDNTKEVTELGKDEILYAGDEVIIWINGSVKSAQIVNGLAATTDTIPYKGKTCRIYTVKKDTSGEGASGQIEISVVPRETGSAGASDAPCGCGSYLYTWKACLNTAAIRHFNLNEKVMRQFAVNGCGIPTGDGWKNGSYRGVYGRVKDNLLEKLLNKMLSGSMTVNVKWTGYDEQTKSEQPLDDDGYFIAGQQYVSTVTFTALDEYQHVFLQNTEFIAANHTLVGTPQISDDGKTATIKILHKLPVTEPVRSIVVLRRADTGKIIPYEEELKANDRITLSAADGYSVYIMGGLIDTGETTADGKKIFRVVRGSSGGRSWSHIELMVITEADSDGCGCENQLYQHAIAAVKRQSRDSGQNADTHSSGSASAAAGTGKQLVKNYILGDAYLEYYIAQAGGIPVGDGWASGSLSKLDSKVQNNLLQTYLTSVTGGRYTYSVSWSQYDAASGMETILLPDAEFREGRQYVSTVTIQAAKGYNAVFSDQTVFAFGDHILLGDPEISADGSTATIRILHTIGELDENALKLYWADTGAEIADQTSLEPGDRVRVEIAQGYRYRILCGLQATDEYGVYTVAYGRSSDGELGGIEVLFYKQDTGDGLNCGCGTLLYKHSVGDVGGYGSADGQVKGIRKFILNRNADVISLDAQNADRVSKGPAIQETGDESRSWMWLIFSAGSLMGLYAWYRQRRRKAG